MNQMNTPIAEPDSGAKTRWLITFTDLISLLLAFFVMLFSMAAVEPEPFKLMTDSLQEHLNPDFAWDSLAALGDLDADTSPLDDAADLDYLQAVITEKIRAIPLLSDSRVARLDDRLIISLPADSLFAVGSADLQDEAIAALAVMGDTLRHVSNRLDVNGHTDPSPVRGGPFASNWELSVYRAQAVADALIGAGYTQSIAAIGFAESRYENKDGLDRAESYRRARRVDVVIRETQSTAGNYGS